MDWEWFWIVALTMVVVMHEFLDIYFVRRVLWRNKLLTELAVNSIKNESESLSSRDESE